jgi:hypothetical protein
LFKVSLIENAGAAYETALDALKRILSGEGSYINYRLYVLNLHSAMELFFKKMLFDKSEFMMFSFKDFDSLLKKYEQSKKVSKSIFEYVATHKDANTKLPKTVTFEEAYKRLAYLYNNPELDEEFISKLDKLNSLRNNITHFELEIEHDEFVLLNEIFLKCVDIYSDENEWGYSLDEDLEAKIKDTNASIKDCIMRDKFNRKIIESIMDGQTNGWVGETSARDFKFIAEILIEEYNFDENDRDKIMRRLDIFYNLGFTEDCSTMIGEYGEASWFAISNLCSELYNATK